MNDIIEALHNSNNAIQIAMRMSRDEMLTAQAHNTVEDALLEAWRKADKILQDWTYRSIYERPSFAYRARVLPTSEHWSPREPLLQHRDGSRYYLGVCSYVFIGGVALVVYAPGRYSTSGEALEATMLHIKKLPTPMLEKVVKMLPAES